MSISSGVVADPEETAPGPADPAGRPFRFLEAAGRVSPPARFLGLMLIAYVVLFGMLTWRQHSNFGTFGFDLGIYDQGIWLLSQFEDPFVTVRGLNYFGHHVNLLTLVFVPFYWLGAGPHALLLGQTIVLALAAVPVWLLGRDKLANPWLALALAGAFLLQPSFEWINWWHFHPDALIITPLLFAYWLSTRGRWGWFSVAVAAAILAKEDAALAVLVLGLVVAWRGDRRAGLSTAAVGAAWFVLATKVIIPTANGGEGPLYEELFPGFGHSVGEIAWNMLTDPRQVLDLILEGERLDYYRMLLAPVAFLGVLYPPALAIGVPQALINAMSAHGYTHDIRYHYSAIVEAGVILATVEACARVSGRAGIRRFLVGAVFAAALAANVAWSPSPLGVKYKSGIWASKQPKHAAVNDALERVPARAGVAATYYLVPHLTHRTVIYEWPNPWVVSNWGIRGENPGQPAQVDYLVLDVPLNGDRQALYESLTGPNGQFEQVFDRDGIVVARRRAS